MEKVIITAAITGAATVPTLTPYLPLTPEQIAEKLAQLGEHPYVSGADQAAPYPPDYPPEGLDQTNKPYCQYDKNAKTPGYLPLFFTVNVADGVVTDNGNVILDVHNLQILKPLELESTLNQITGVVANGLFARRGADVLLLGGENGVQTLTR